VSNRQCICDAVDGWIEYYFPKPPPTRPSVYISAEARETITHLKASGAVAGEAKPEEAVVEEEVDVEGGPQTADSVPGAHGGILDEPMEAAAVNHGSPLRQQMHQNPSPVDNNATTRLMVRPHHLTLLIQSIAETVAATLAATIASCIHRFIGLLSSRNRTVFTSFFHQIILLLPGSRATLKLRK